jgi:rod shape-determining protein MreC
VADYFGSAPRRGRREVVLVGGVLLVALALFAMPAAYQAEVRQTLRGTVLRPFFATQAGVVGFQARRAEVSVLRAQRDSLSALVAAQAPLSEENQRLRSLLGLQARAPDGFIAAEVLRIGGSAGESSFILRLGREDGVVVGSPVLAPEGLLGLIWEVDGRSAQGIDWTHPDFQAAAMTADARAYGFIEPRRGSYRDQDMLALTGAPFHIDLQPGTRIVTSGRGGVIPRGIPLGTVVGIEDADTGWRKSYLIRPAVQPTAAAHVLVGIRRGEARPESDLSGLWHVGAPPDTATPWIEPEPDGAPPGAP